MGEHFVLVRFFTPFPFQWLITALRRCIIVMIGLLIPLALPTWASQVDAGQQQLDQLNQRAMRDQKQINHLADQTDAAFTEYRELVRQAENLNRYNAQLQQIITAQHEELTALNQQIEALEVTRRDIVPLMLDMLDGLEAFIALDLPFLPDERTQRVKTLRELLNRADVTTSEKYRQILDAYLTEVEYGRTIEAYEQDLALPDGQRHVELLRIGRLALLYKTRDDTQAGIWYQNQWQELPAEYLPDIRRGLRIARRQAAPDLLRLPLPVATEVTP
jgi:septal ring factor EnvC (AmiA/AmiB activator)